jgi:hypothetical protein
MENKKSNTSIDDGKCCGASRPEGMALLYTNIFSSPTEASCLICNTNFSNFNCYCEIEHDCNPSEEVLASRARREEIAYLNTLFALEGEGKDE